MSDPLLLKDSTKAPKAKGKAKSARPTSGSFITDRKQLFDSNSKAKSQPQLLEPVKEEEVPQRSEEFLDLIMKAAVKHGN
jgi:hypothetical protein